MRLKALASKRNSSGVKKLMLGLLRDGRTKSLTGFSGINLFLTACPKPFDKTFLILYKEQQECGDLVIL
jgi:hypothetical protein